MEGEAVAKIKRNPKAFYAYAKRFQKTKSGIGPLINEKDEIINKPEEVAEVLRNQYKSVFTEPREDKAVGDPEEFLKRNENTKFSNVFFNHTDIREAIDKLSKNA